MLHELHVSDLGVIEDVDLAFDAGLNVLTGETGAGKTMITVALALALALDADGRSTARVGGQLAPVSALERLAGDLVELHGQHESTSLRTASAQTAFLDRFAGREHVDRL